LSTSLIFSHFRLLLFELLNEHSLVVMSCISMLSSFGDFSSFHALGSFENHRLVGFFLFCASLHEGEHRFMALMVVGIQKVGATTWSKVQPVTAFREWLVDMYELPIEAKTNFLFM